MMKPLAAVAALSVAALGGYMLSSTLNVFGSAKPADVAVAAPSENNSEQPQSNSWVVAAPGRIEPKGGEVRLASGIMGRISHVLVKVNDDVEVGEVLIRLDDREARARLAAAEAEAAARQKQRDLQKTPSSRSKIIKAKDDVYNAERALTGARFSLDEALIARRKGLGSDLEVRDAASRHARAERRLNQARVTLAIEQTKANAPLPSLFESALSRARADVAAADALLAKTRIRASIGGKIMRLRAKVGEMVAPGPQQTLVVIGNTLKLRVKAEIDEGDIAKIELGQKVFVRSPSHPNKKFWGTVAVIAPSLARPQIGRRGPRRPTDVEVLEVSIDLDKNTPLLSGLRVDAFFKKAK